jgi:hypothetical protein
LTAEWGPIQAWDTSQVTSCEDAFSKERNEAGDDTDPIESNTKAVSFNADLSRWKTAKCTSMKKVFYKAASFNSDLSKW